MELHPSASRTAGQNSYFLLIVFSILLLALPSSLSSQNIIIDDFSTPQALIFAIGAGSSTSSFANTAGTDILGGQRDVEITVAAGAVVSVETIVDAYNFSVAAATTGESLISWDGADDMPASTDIDFTGLGGVDITSGGNQDSMQIILLSSDQPGTLILTAYTDAANFSTYTQVIPVTGVSTMYNMPLSDFVVGGGAGADFTNVGAITMFTSGTEIDARFDLLQMAALIDSTKTDALLIDTDFDGQAGPGDTVRYTVVIDNPDDAADAASDGVLFSSDVDANTTLVVGSVTTTQGMVTTGNTAGDTSVAVTVGSVLDATSVTITYDVLIANPVPMGLTQILCQGMVASDELALFPTDDPDDPTSSTDPTLTPIVSPVVTSTKVDALQVDPGVDGVVNPGDTVRYTITLNNTGTGPATNVMFTNPAVANTSLVVGSVTTSSGSVTTGNTAGDTTVLVDVGAIAPMGSVTITFDVVVSPLPAGVTMITCQGTITGDNFTMLPTDDPDVVGAGDPTDTPVVGTPDLAITKDDGGATTAPGGTVAYTLSYTNNGNQDATGVTLTETVPANSTFNAGASTAGWACLPDGNAGSTCTLAIGALAVSAGGMATFAVDVDDPLPAGVTQLSNTASVADDGANGTDPTPADNTDSDTTPINAAPDLAITKDDGGASTMPGGSVSYTLSYANNGDQDATGVVITNVVPANTTFDPGSSTAGWSCAPNNNAGSTCTLNVGSLAGGGASGMATFAVIVDDPIPGGVTEVACSVSIADDGANGADPTPADNTDSDTTPIVASPDLTITKDDGGITTTPSGTVAYTLDYTNVGDQNATGVVITNVVPANATFDPGSSTAGWSCAPNNNAGSTCTLAIGAVNTGDMGSATFAVIVDDPLPSGITQIDCTASIADDGANGPDGNPMDNTSSDNTPVDAAPNLAVTKDDGGSSVVPGGTVSYTLDYANNGNQDATGVVLTTSVPPNTTFNAGASTAGWVCAPDGNPGSTCTLAIGALAGGASGMATFAVTVNDPVPAGLTQISCSVTIADDGTNGPDPDTSDNTDSDDTPVNAAPNLSIVKDDSGANAFPGLPIVYTLTYANNGNQGATGVVLTTEVPVHTTFDAGSSTAGWSCVPSTAAGSTCTFNVGSVLAGGGDSVDFAVTVVDPIPAGVTEIACSASIADDGLNGPDPDPMDNTDSDTTPIVDPFAIVEATKADALLIDSDMDGLVDGGETVRYTVVLENITGAVDALNTIFTTPAVPFTTLVVGSVTTTQGMITSGNTAGDVSVAVDVGTVPGNGTVTITFDVLVESPLSPSALQLICQGTVTGDNIPTEPTDDPETGIDDDPTVTPLDVTVPIVDAFKTATMIVGDNGNGTADPGETIAYQVTIDNQGPGTALDVVYTDTPDPNTTLVNGSVVTSQGTVTAGNGAGDLTIAIDVGDMPQGTMVTVDYQVDVNSPLPPGTTELVNQGLVQGTNIFDTVTDETTTTDVDDPTIVPVTPTPPPEIPTLDHLGLGLLALLLGAAARRRLRRS